MEPTGVQFNKGSVAKAIRAEIIKMQNADKLPTETQQRAASLFAAISKAFPTKSE